MPPKGSTMANYLEKTLASVKQSLDRRPATIIAPPPDPLGTICTGDPSPWYLCDKTVFLWLPFHTFKSILQLSSIPCIYCSKKRLTPKSYKWRPMFNHDKIDWLLYQRIRCQECKKSWLSTDKNFLSKLPTRIVERFPYMVPKRGPGLHESMVLSISNLCTKQISYGPYVNMINKLHKTQYTRQSLSYYDACSKQNVNSALFGLLTPTPFSEFHSKGEFGGLTFSKKLLQYGLNNLVGAKEKYIQAYFQTCSDSGCSADHTHKWSKVI